MTLRDFISRANVLVEDDSDYDRDLVVNSRYLLFQPLSLRRFEVADGTITKVFFELKIEEGRMVKV
jgi:hypothetical protein